jgi:23S rRNA (pseudouridine1915-N3)-methyltransferase
MHIRIVAVGRIKEPGFVLAQDEYAKRLLRYTRLEIIEVDDEPVPSGDQERQAVKIREGERLQRRVPQGCLLVAMDSMGAQFTSEAFAAWLGQQQMTGRGNLVFMLGGTLGLPPTMLAQAYLRLSLSAFTFPHQLARVVLMEQLYRSFRILRQEPYHY